MSNRKVSKSRKTNLLKVLIPAMVVLTLFGWLGYTQLQNITDQAEDSQPLETENRQDTAEQEELGKPNKPEEPEEQTEEETEEPAEEPTGNWWDYPSQILPATRSGNDLLVLVNKKYKLPSSYAPSDLVSAGGAGIRLKGNGNYQVRTILIDNLKALNDAAKAEIVDLSVVSAYRSYSTQASTYQYWVNYNGGNTDAADTISARPGHSQHQLGTAVDFSSNEIGDRLGEEFNNTNASKWLAANGWKYGFVIGYPKGHEVTTGYSYESWHYRYIGKENAAQWRSSGKILEVWLREKNGL
jgi:LAS superfamily LD-carboxypeptidase LdcB